MNVSVPFDELLATGGRIRDLERSRDEANIELARVTSLYEAAEVEVQRLTRALDQAQQPNPVDSAGGPGERE